MQGPAVTIMPFIYKINTYIINPIIMLVFAVAMLIFFYGIFEFIRAAPDMGRARDDGKKKITYGLIGMFIMFSAYGFVRLVLTTFDITPPSTVTETVYP